MAGWPRDNRDSSTSSLKERGDGRRPPVDKQFPYLGPGMTGAATLTDIEGRMEWDFMRKKNTQEIREQRLQSGKISSWFPPTRSVSNTEFQTAKQRFDTGIDFLSTYVPDAWFPNDILEEQLMDEAFLAHEARKGDPYMGNVLGVYETDERTSVLFPMGEVQQDLNISTVCQVEAGQYTFMPSTSPAHLFKTPIQQIVVGYIYDDAALAVRTYGAIEFFRLKQQRKGHTLTHLESLPSSACGPGAVVDLQFLPTFWEAIIASDTGAVYHCSFMDPLSTRTLIPRPAQESTNLYYKIGMGTNPDVCFHMSDKVLTCLDTRQRGPSNWYTHPTGKSVLTSIEVDDEDNHIRLCTMDRLLWLDMRKPNSPLLVYDHHRQYDRSLQTTTMHTLDHCFSFLTSRNNALVTVYDVSRSGELVSMQDHPYCVTSDPDMYKPSCGFAVLEEPLGMLSVSLDGSLNFATLQSKQFPDDRVTVQETKDLAALKARSTTRTPFLGNLGVYDYQELDLRVLRDKISSYDIERIEEEEETKKDAIYDVIDNTPTFWERREVPTESILTTFDLAIRSGDEPSTFSRADFLTGNMLHSKRGYRAVHQGRLSASKISAPWKASIADTITCLDPDFETDPDKLIAYLRTFHQEKNDDDREKRRYEDTAAKHLAIDLALATDVYSERPFVERSGLESLTEALSIAEAPPPVTFHYFEPIEERKEESRRVLQPPEIPTGVRLLMKDWDARPVDKYEYQDPLDRDADDRPRPRRRVASPTPPPPRSQPSQARGGTSQSQRPPEVIAAGVVRQPPVIGASSQVVESDVRVRERPIQSQEMVINTQVMPGPHGGRPGAKKKKRVGGF